MSLTINIYYTGKNGSAKEFANEMISRGIVNKVRNMSISFLKMTRKPFY